MPTAADILYVVSIERTRLRLQKRPKELSKSKQQHSLQDIQSSSPQELLTHINETIQKRHFWLLKLFLLLLMLAGVLLVFVSLYSISQVKNPTWTTEVIASFVGALLYLLTFLIDRKVHQIEKSLKTTTIYYTFDATSKEEFKNLLSGLTTLETASSVWVLTDVVQTWDWKRNAGASSLINRHKMIIKRVPPPLIRTNVKPFSLLVGRTQIFFFPEWLFVFRNGTYRLVKYDEVEVAGSTTRFIEDGSVPSDSNVVGYTWRYVRKDGGPDMRFANNRKIPIVEYGYLSILLPDLNVQFHTSNADTARHFAEAVNVYTRRYHSRNTHHTRTHSNTRTNKADDEQKYREEVREFSKDTSAYSILGLSPTASSEQIVVAYRKKAQQYHPDKVANLAPEFQELADKRMKEINAAYEELKRKKKV